MILFFMMCCFLKKLRVSTCFQYVLGLTLWESNIPKMIRCVSQHFAIEFNHF